MFAGLFVSLFLQVAQANCISIADVQDIQKSVQLPSEFREADLCNEKSNSYKLMETILFMKNNRFPGDKVPAPLNQNILPDDFWSFFTKNLKKISNQGVGNSCQGVIAFVLSGFGDSEINICPGFYSDTTFMIERLSVLMHESRHLDPVTYRHSVCQDGYSKGRKSCDESLEAKGSYGVSVESLAKMIVSPAFSDRDHAYGKLLLLQYLTRSFNAPVHLGNGRYTALLLTDENGLSSVFDGEVLQPLPLIPTGEIINRYFSVVVAPVAGGDLFTADLFSAKPAHLPVFTDSFLKYNQTPVLQRPRILAVLNQKTYQAMITDREITVNPLAPFMLESEITQVYSAEDLGSSETNSFFVRDSSKNLYHVRWDTKAVKMTLANEEWPFSFEPLSVSVLQNQRLALNEAGQVLIFVNGQWNSYVPLQGKKFRSMTGAFLWNSALFN